jgi:hypothetical protein
MKKFIIIFILIVVFIGIGASSIFYINKFQKQSLALKIANQEKEDLRVSEKEKRIKEIEALKTKEALVVKQVADFKKQIEDFKKIVEKLKLREIKKIKQEEALKRKAEELKLKEAKEKETQLNKEMISKKEAAKLAEIDRLKRSKVIERKAQLARKRERQRELRLKKKTKIKKSGLVVVGYTSYNIYNAFWRTNLESDYETVYPDGRFLIVELGVMNLDTKLRTIPPFHLEDSNGKEYNSTYPFAPGNYVYEDMIPSYKNLNPNVATMGYVIFDVPYNVGYRLKLSGGTTSTDTSYYGLK